jgi:hypothetical protein
MRRREVDIKGYKKESQTEGEGIGYPLNVDTPGFCEAIFSSFFKQFFP